MRTYWDELRNFQVDDDILTLSTIGKVLPQAPIPQPMALTRLLRNYALELFEDAALHYPASPFLEDWLATLGEQISRMIEQRLKYAHNLDLHLSVEDINSAINDGIEGGIDNRLRRKRKNKRQTETQARPDGKQVRLSSTITCPSAARKLEQFLTAKVISVPKFAEKAQTTDRTIRSFRKTGKVRRSIFENIANAMGITKEELLR